MGCGEQCVVICGEQQMQLWCAGNWDIQVQVNPHLYARMAIILFYANLLN